MKRFFVLCLCLCLLFSGCGYDPYDPTVLGYYEGTTIIAEGYEIPMTRIYAGENYIALSEDGEGTMTLAGHSYPIQWGFREQRFTWIWVWNSNSAFHRIMSPVQSLHLQSGNCSGKGIGTAGGW